MATDSLPVADPPIPAAVAPAGDGGSFASGAQLDRSAIAWPIESGDPAGGSGGIRLTPPQPGSREVRSDPPRVACAGIQTSSGARLMYHFLFLTTILTAPFWAASGSRIRADAPGSLGGPVDLCGAVLRHPADAAEVASSAGGLGRLTATLQPASVVARRRSGLTPSRHSSGPMIFNSSAASTLHKQEAMSVGVVRRIGSHVPLTC